MSIMATMCESLEKLAKERFPNLTEAETRILEAAINGEPAICGPNSNDADQANDPSNDVNWLPSRTIRADILEWLCTTDGVSGRVSRQGIHIYAGKISGVLKFAYATIPFPLFFQRCAFSEDISFKNARIPSLILTSSSTHTILADGIEVAGNVLLNENFHSRGQVLFRDAKIGGGFRAEGGFFEYASGTTFDLQSENALGCDRLKVNGSVFLSTSNCRSTFKGEVGLAGAFIGSNLECDGGTFDNAGKFSIRADRVTTVGSIFLRDGFVARGAVRIINATMQVLDCTRGTFEGDGNSALNAEGATIRGAAVFDGSITCSGGMQLRAVEAGDVSCRISRFTSFDLRRARIQHVLRWKEIVDAPDTILDLRDASIGSIEDDEASWPTVGNFYADGLRYEGLTGHPTDVDARLRWIGLDTSCSPQLYRHLATVYKDAGETKYAREVLYRLESLLHDRQSGPIAILWSFLLKWTIGYGYKLWMAFMWLILITIIGISVSSIGYRDKVIAPTEKDAYTYFETHQQAPASYQRFSSFMYSVEHSIPAINLGVSTNWSANAVAQLPGHPYYVYGLRWWFCAQTLLGWGLSIFFIAGLTGLVKSDK